MNRAIVRKPATSLQQGLSSADLGLPDYALALAQHRRYCTALQACGLELISLDADTTYPDSTFVEDIAVLHNGRAILTRPGAASRVGEVSLLSESLQRWFGKLETIEAPGTLEGGDVCGVGNHYFIGISQRTNEAGAEQLSRHLAELGCSSTFIDVRSVDGLLHLKSGLASVGNNQLVVREVLASRKELAGYNLIRVDTDEEYAANCVRINDYVLIAAGYPKLQASLVELGYQTIPLDMSEFQKLDGGLSCLSLRF